MPVQIEHLAVTGTTTLAGLALALALGVLLALLVVYVRPLESILLPVLAGFNGIPKVAIAPLFVIWFGLDLPLHIHGPLSWMTACVLLLIYLLLSSFLRVTLAAGAYVLLGRN